MMNTTNASANLKKKLTRNDIVEITGIASLDKLIELEILFTTVNEIDSLQECTHLKRLAMIDNGLQCISNLYPIGNTLLSLCLCDQSIVIMENLELPNLQELFLHRNLITTIDGLHGCPRLKKLWLCQNNITEIANMHCVPELEELFLQANKLTRLNGLESNHQLKHLGLAGNEITEFEELYKLSALPQLNQISLLDIHFGRCPLTDEIGYKEFIVTYLPSVRVLDGVTLSRDVHHNAEVAYFQQLKQFDDALRGIEEEYRNDILRVDNQLKSREGHSSVLEKEMTAALNELQGLVTEGRDVMLRQSKRQQSLIDKNLQTLQKTLELHRDTALASLSGSLSRALEEQDLTLSYLCKLERVASADAVVTSLLSDISTSTLARQNNSQSRSDSSAQLQGFIFQTINPISPEFIYFDTTVGCRHQRPTSGRSISEIYFNGGEIEAARLYRVSAPISKSDRNQSSRSSQQSRLSVEQARTEIYRNPKYVKLFTLMTVEEFSETLSGSSNAWNSLTPPLPNRLFCTNAGLIPVLNECAPESFYYDFLSELSQSKAAGKAGESLKVESMKKLQYALQLKMLLVVGCWVDTSAVGLSIFADGVIARSSDTSRPRSAAGLKSGRQLPSQRLNEEVSTTILPRDKKERIQILTDLAQAYSATACNVEIPDDADEDSVRMQTPGYEPRLISLDVSSNIPNLLVAIPCNLLTLDPSDGRPSTAGAGSTGVNPARIDTVSVCIYYPPHLDGTMGRSGGEGIRDTEIRLEALSIPSVSSSKTSEAILELEREVNAAVQRFTDLILEEMDATNAESLIQSEVAITQQEQLLKKIREDIDGERRRQDAGLKDVRNIAAVPDNGGPVSGTGPSATNQNSSRSHPHGAAGGRRR